MIEMQYRLYNKREEKKLWKWNKKIEPIFQIIKIDKFECKEEILQVSILENNEDNYKESQIAKR